MNCNLEHLENETKDFCNKMDHNLLIILTLILMTSLNIENNLNEDEIMNKSSCY